LPGSQENNAKSKQKLNAEPAKKRKGRKENLPLCMFMPESDWFAVSTVFGVLANGAKQQEPESSAI
jgi:hypothetical protein